MNNAIKILAIETSCDETAAAVITAAPTKLRMDHESTNEQPIILSNIVSSQVDLHAKTGGVVPEVASRAHMHAIMPIIEEALLRANSKKQETITKQIPNSNDQVPNNNETMKQWSNDLLSGITHIAVTNGPGLIGSLLVGFNAAKTIAYAKKLPLIPINHIEGHIYSAVGGARYKKQDTITKQIPNSKFQTIQQFNNSTINFPILALTVSGGHTSLTIMRDHGVYETIGETIDDAAGEAFDKVAKLLGLGYPGGPVVSKFASEFRNKLKNRRTKEPKNNLEFPRPLMDKPNFDFSFSGLKTAVLTEVIKRLKDRRTKELKNNEKEEICWAFEEAVVDVLVTKTMRAARKYKPKAVILAGGVAANRRLREKLTKELKNLRTKERLEIELMMPPISLCGDNAAMIGLAAYYHIIKNNIPELFETTVNANLEL